MHIAILIFLTFTLIQASQPYKKVIPAGDPNARCLDGTPPAVYLHEGGDRSKFIIYFMGGGYCAGVEISGTLETCYQRTKTQFGSSDLLPQQFIGQGYLSTDPQINSFSTWTKIIVNYCDGSMHQGYAKDPIQYKDTHLYFRGSANVKSHIQWLVKDYDLPNAQKIMLTGVSAGGIATFLWSDYVKSLMKRPEGFSAVIDSGIFLNEPSVITGMLKLGVSFSNLYKVANADQSTPLTKCNEFYPNQEYKCLFIEYAHEFIIHPNLWINSEYDLWSIPNILDVFCVSPCETGYTLLKCNQTQLNDIETYRRKYLNVLDKLIAKENSIWTIACSNHGYGLLNKFYNVEQQKVPQQIGKTVKQTVEKFILNHQQDVSIDFEPWPNNELCAY